MQPSSIQEYRLRNEYIEVAFINLGATLIEFIDVPSKTNVVLRYKNIEDYAKNPYYMGSLVGRYAGRIQNASYDGQAIDANFLNKHHLHGGFHGFSHKFFDVVETTNSLVFTYSSPHLEGGFLHEVHVTLKVWLDTSSLCYDLRAVPKGKTLINLTAHHYFNLSGLTQDIKKHALYIASEEYVALNEEVVPVKKVTLDHSPLDFRVMKPIESAFDFSHEQIQRANGIDHPFVLSRNEEVVILKNATLALQVTTNQPCVVIYTGNFLSNTFDSQFFPNAGVCIECQGIPNHMHISGHEDENTYDEHHPYHQVTTYTLTPLK